MSFMGKTRSIDQQPSDVQGVRRDTSAATGGAYSGQGPFGGAFQPVPFDDSGAFLQQLLKPYMDLFTAQRGAGLAQAKESAGNLTGSGYNNILGSSLAQSLAGEQAQIAQLGSTFRGQNINLRGQDLARQSDLLHFLLQFATQPGTVQTAYQPGFLDSAGGLLGNLLGLYLARDKKPATPGGGGAAPLWKPNQGPQFGGPYILPAGPPNPGVG